MRTSEPNATMYRKWNDLTRACYNRHCVCLGCENRAICNVRPMSINPLNMKPVKYAVLMTYKNIGKEGLENDD